MASDCDVLIAGGGVGGAALALALAHGHRLRVLVIERRSGPGNVNRGDSLLPAVTAHLHRWGALERVREAGARPVAKMQVFDGASARMLFEAPLTAPSSAPYLVLPHPRIERALLDAAVATGRVEVRYGCRAERLLDDEGRVRGMRVVEQDAARELSAALVVGADGSSSFVRDALGLELESLPYDHGFFIIDVDRPDHYEDAMRIELCAEGGILVVPQDDGRVGLGVLVRPNEEALFRAGALEDKLAAIGQRSRLLAGRRAFPGSHLYKVWRGHSSRYVARGAALIGDAVHVTNPTAGQGMTMAIEDAAALARHVGPIVAAGGQLGLLDRALATYERERHPRNEAAIRWSHWMSRGYAFEGRVASALRRQVFALGATPLGQHVQRRVWSRMATRSIAG
jgi:2-polyprenyl-6-methoxyphenol hydroxylase-like FAD-dependent oxidoreductase